MNRQCLAAAAATICAAIISGCGSSSQPGQSSVGSVAVAVRWPDLPTAAGNRVIPAAARSIVIDVWDGQAMHSGHALIVRPATSATIGGIAAGNCFVSATARQNADGTGAALASGSAKVIVYAFSDTQVPLTLDAAPAATQ